MNLGGQPAVNLEVVLQDSDFISAQEVARDDPGWQEIIGENFYWLMHRHRNQYRGVGIGVAQDLLDCVIENWLPNVVFGLCWGSRELGVW